MDAMSLILLLIFALLCMLLNFMPIQFKAPVEHAETDDLTWSMEERTTVTHVS